MIEFFFYFFPLFLILTGFLGLWMGIKYYKTGVWQGAELRWYDENDINRTADRDIFFGVVSLIVGVISFFVLLAVDLHIYFNLSRHIILLLSGIATSLIPLSIILFLRSHGVTIEDIKKINQL
ncbi:MAG TPA: hypothetical protein PLO36_01490 [Methanofastidiosum sp.]|nr:hypothetical protein [Methanofastidiosum sp.]HQK63392.1 hypothetical protein [Methanofastidiosum sp.]HQM94061.1 hypothetical protein [Methanofastidiosum sp.]HQQ48133.1 hypothetical protein [Methanofastidiosum sp.]